MEYTEAKRDLFTVPKEYYLVHCIASDLMMGAGIAVPMQKAFGLRDKIRQSGHSTAHPTCVLVDRVFNLITKKKSYGKPTNQSMRQALQTMRELVDANNIKKIAMPKIGCGRDKLQWPEVRSMIFEVFGDIDDLEVFVCNWRG